MTTVAAAIDAVHAQFAAAGLSYGHGTDNAWDEAVVLVLSITRLPDDTSSLERDVAATDFERIQEIAAARATERVPLAHLLGVCHYMGFEFEITPDVVVPRSPIGYLLHEGLEPWLPDRIERILDLCSGSGCLGLVAASLFAGADVTLVELDANAAALAERNALRHAPDGRVSVVVADATALPDMGKFDLVITNPPYVDAADMQSLPAEYHAEPALGLAGGDDGLIVMRGILRQLPHLLAAEGLFVGEVGNSAAALARAYPRLPFVWPELPRGGEGVFILEGGALDSHTAADFS